MRCTFLAAEGDSKVVVDEIVGKGDANRVERTEYVWCNDNRRYIDNDQARPSF